VVDVTLFWKRLISEVLSEVPSVKNTRTISYVVDIFFLFTSKVSLCPPESSPFLCTVL